MRTSNGPTCVSSSASIGLHIMYVTFLFIYFMATRLLLASFAERRNRAVGSARCISSVPVFIAVITSKDKNCRSSRQAAACGEQSFPCVKLQSCLIIIQMLWRNTTKLGRVFAGERIGGSGVLKSIVSMPVGERILTEL